MSSNPRFYCPMPLVAGLSVRLPDEVCRHVQVLRMKPGEPMTLFTGTGGEYAARLTLLTAKSAEAEVLSFNPLEREPTLRLSLAQGISSGDRMDYTLQKAVELGVVAIQPLLTARSIVKLPPERWAKKQAHWQQVVTSACEQCGRNQVPVLYEPIEIGRWLRDSAITGLLLAPGGAGSVRELPPRSEAWLLAGPEGGLTDDEVTRALESGWQPLTLGPRVLRTETAALAAAAALQTLWGDF